MSQYTELSVIAISGKTHTFTAKQTISITKGSGTFTQLSVLGLSGRRSTFTAKAPSTGTGKALGIFTELSTIATAGKKHIFTAKSQALTTSTTTHRKYGGIQHAQILEKHRLERIHQDDEAILEVVMNFILNCKD